jgi:hypothetical protein
MSYSKVMADRMMLDIKALIIALQYAIFSSHENGDELENEGKKVLKAAKKDIDTIEKDYIMADSLVTYYNYSIHEQCIKFRQVIDYIESGSFKDANTILDELNKEAEEKLSEHLRERVA